MKLPAYELAEALNYTAPKSEYRDVRVRERTVLRHGSGVRVLSDRVVTRSCRVHNGNAVLV